MNKDLWKASASEKSNVTSNHPSVLTTRDDCQTVGIETKPGLQVTNPRLFFKESDVKLLVSGSQLHHWEKVAGVRYTTVSLGESC